MSSEAVTRNDLKAILDEVLPSKNYIPSWESMGEVYWGTGTWTVPEDGFLLIYIEPSTTNWYYRISDSSVPDTGWSYRWGSTSSALSQSDTCLVKKGAILKDHSKSNVSAVHAFYFKFILKEALPEAGGAECIIASGWTNYSDGINPIVVKSGNVCTFSWVCKPTSAINPLNDTWRLVCTIPQGYRPLKDLFFIAQGSGTSFFLFSIGSTGEVKVSRLRDVGNANGAYTNAETWMWFPLNATYVIGR